MNKLYDRIDFHNGSAPAINETNLNAMSKAIDDIDSRVADLYISQVDVEEVKADTALTKKYRDEAYSTTPQGYADLVTDVSQLKSEVSNPNLLDNPFFQVNQRGQSSYSGSGYCVDRWRSWATGANTINSDKSISIDRQIGQFINDVDGIKGKTLTLSVMYSNGTIYSASANIPTTLTAKRLIDYRITSNVDICLYSDGQGHVSAQFNNQSGTAIAIKAVKLEYGSISTLSNDHAPNYADELLRCQYSEADSSDQFANCGKRAWTYDNTNLTFSNCAYGGGGIKKIGCIATVQLRISTSSAISTETALVSGLPTPFVNTNCMALNGYCNDGTVAFAYIRASDGKIVTGMPLASGKSYIFNGTYMTKY